LVYCAGSIKRCSHGISGRVKSGQNFDFLLSLFETAVTIPEKAGSLLKHLQRGFQPLVARFEMLNEFLQAF